MGLKAVFFDLDDTLVPTSECDRHGLTAASALAGLRTESFIDEGKLIEDFKDFLKRTPWDLERKVNVNSWRAGLWEQALEKQHVYGAKLLSEELQEVFQNVRMSKFSLCPRVLALFQFLMGKGLHVVVVTNGHHKIQRDKLAACCIHDYLQNPANIVIGGEEVLEGRAEKPAASIFFKACRIVGCMPEEAIHVGDSLETDIQGGINAGLLATVWVNVWGVELCTGNPKPTFEVKNVCDVENIVERLL